MELLVMMVVVAILSGVAATSLSGLTSSQQDVAVTRARSALIHAQLWAIGSGTSTWVAFDTANDKVSVFCEDPSNLGKSNRIALLDPLSRNPIEIQLDRNATGIQSAAFGATSEVQFDALGIPHNANGVLLTSDGLVNFEGNIGLRVVRNTGFITVD